MTARYHLRTFRCSDVSVELVFVLLSSWGSSMPVRSFAVSSFLAPGLLTVVAVMQMWVSSQTPLSAWKLGGFGMYSSVDSVGARWIRPVLVTPRGELPLMFDRLVGDRPDLAQAARAVRAWPDAIRLGEIGDVLLNQSGTWADCTPTRLAEGGRVSGHFVRPMIREQIRGLGCRRLPVTGLRLEIWRYRYESAERRVVGEKILETASAAAVSQ